MKPKFGNLKFKYAACLLVILIGVISCGQSKQQIEEEANQREAKVKADELKREADEARLRVQAEENSRKEKIHQYQEELLNSLNDPASAQFRNLHLSTGKGGDALCGEVNAKNSFGGYVGFTPFAVTEKHLDNTNSRVIIATDNGDWLHRMSNQIRLSDAGCGELPDVLKGKPKNAP